MLFPENCNHNPSFNLQLTNWSNKLECLSLAIQHSSLLGSTVTSKGNEVFKDKTWFDFAISLICEHSLISSTQVLSTTLALFVSRHLIEKHFADAVIIIVYDNEYSFIIDICFYKIFSTQISSACTLKTFSRHPVQCFR